MDLLIDELWREPDTEVNLQEIMKSAATNKGSGAAGKAGEDVAREFKLFWNTLG